MNTARWRKELVDEIAPLPSERGLGTEEAKRFDLLMFSLELALLKGSAKMDDASDAQRGLTRAGAAPPVGKFEVNPNAPYAHPFYWAAFALIGEGRSGAGGGAVRGGS